MGRGLRVNRTRRQARKSQKKALTQKVTEDRLITYDGQDTRQTRTVGDDRVDDGGEENGVGEVREKRTPLGQTACTAHAGCRMRGGTVNSQQSAGSGGRRFT